MSRSSPPFIANHLIAIQAKSTSLIIKVALLVMLLFIFLIPWGNVVWDGFTRVFGIAAFGLSMLVLIVHGTHRNYSLAHLFSLMFGGWVTITMIWSPDIVAGKESLKTLLQLLFTFFIISLLIDSKDKIRLAYQSYVFGASVGSFIIIYNFINGIESRYWGRYGLANYEVDGVAITIVLAIPMAAYIATQYKSRIFKVINAISIPLCIFAIFLTATRTASIAAVFGIAYWLFTYRKANIKIKLIIFTFLLSSIVGVFTLAPKSSVDRIFSSGKSISSGTLNYRTVIWGASLDQWKKAPIVGSGIGSLSYVLSPYHVQYGSAHNTFIQVLTEMGIIGLMLYLLLIGSIIYYILHSPINDKAFLFSLLTVLLVNHLSMNTLLGKGSWFVLTMLAIHAYSASKRTYVI